MASLPMERLATRVQVSVAGSYRSMQLNLYIIIIIIIIIIMIVMIPVLVTHLLCCGLLTAGASCPPTAYRNPFSTPTATPPRRLRRTVQIFLLFLANIFCSTTHLQRLATVVHLLVCGS